MTVVTSDFWLTANRAGIPFLSRQLADEEEPK